MASIQVLAIIHKFLSAARIKRLYKTIVLLSTYFLMHISLAFPFKLKYWMEKLSIPDNKMAKELIDWELRSKQWLKQ